MTKCRKLDLPECEYFTTGGCVSPFNCPYKVENESITTATSTPCNLYPLETDKDREISRLKAENAELRARHRVEVVERALVIMAERVLEYAQKAKVTAMTSDGLFSCDKNAQLALLVNDALLKAEQEMARRENNESDF